MHAGRGVAPRRHGQTASDIMDEIVRGADQLLNASTLRGGGMKGVP
jgi:hypothetical protein